MVYFWGTFGVPPKGGEMKSTKKHMKLRIDDDQQRRLKKAAEQNHRSMNKQILHYIDWGLARDETQDNES